MRTIGIATYSLRVRPKRSKEYQILGNIADEISLADLFGECLSSLAKTEEIDKESQVVLRVNRYEREGEALWGLLHSGEYGYEARGINVDTRTESYIRRPTDAEMIPFYYRAYIPGGNDLGLLILQRHGPYGVFTALSRSLRELFSAKLPGHILEINRLVHSDVLRFLTKGHIRTIRVTTHKLPSDIADKLRFLGNRQEVGTYVIELRAKKNTFLSPPRWIEKRRERQMQVIELPTQLRESDANITIRVDYKGTERTIDLNDPANIAPYIDATNEVTLSASGHPTFDSIDVYGQRLIKELLEQLGRA